jgi:hypothetical protein
VSEEEKLDTPKKVIDYNYLFGFSVVGRPKSEENRLAAYKELKEAMDVYLKHEHHHSFGYILIYVSTCLNPIGRGGWVNSNREAHYERAVYCATLEQFLRFKVGPETDVTQFLISPSEENLKEVKREELIKRWFELLPNEKKQKWLHKMLLEAFVQDPTRFL